MLDDLARNAGRMQSDTVSAQTLINLGTHYRNLHGQFGLATRLWFAGNGVDASIAEGMGNDHSEDWIILFNTDKVAWQRRVSAKEADLTVCEKPPVRHQIDRAQYRVAAATVQAPKRARAPAP